VGGLLALLLFHEARLPTRTDAHGVPVPLPEQDRTRWDRATIDEATAILRRALAAGRPGPFQLEAAISAVHCEAPTADTTDWSQIAELYAVLEQLRPSAAVRINRAFAIAHVDGPGAGLALLDGVDDDEPYLALVRGVLLGDAGHTDDAIAELDRARARARNAHEVAQITARIHRLREGTS
ncbi:MAG: hypothetical protein L0206_15435, partial [Actinobacteria bacterium]|nr:hypothetical protein [Actinomycetota bacterium]